MSKPLRGKNARRIPGWRGTCPQCGHKRVRILWNATGPGGVVKVCKRCNSNNSKRGVAYSLG